jgi:hypothetical protein
MYEIDKFKSDVKKVSENNNDINEKIKEMLLIIILYLRYLKNNNVIQPKLFNIIILTIKNINNIKEEIIEKLKKSIYDKDYNNIKYIFENEIFPTFNTLTRNGGKKTIKRKYIHLRRIKTNHKSKLSKKKKGMKTKKSKRSFIYSRNKRGGIQINYVMNMEEMNEIVEELLRVNRNQQRLNITYFLLFCLVIFIGIFIDEYAYHNLDAYRQNRDNIRIRNQNLSQDFEYISNLFTRMFFE